MAKAATRAKRDLENTLSLTNNESARDSFLLEAQVFI
jgi:hypothetical protein